MNHDARFEGLAVLRIVGLAVVCLVGLGAMVVTMAGTAAPRLRPLEHLRTKRPLVQALSRIR
jgi:hypothetical protein